MQPETALNSWREWDAKLSSCPVILGQLSGGRSNHSFLLESSGLQMVLRINGADTVLPNPSRNSEIEIWQAASDKGIAPPLLHVDGQDRFLVSSYIHDDLPSTPQYDQSIVDLAFGLLKQCHQLDVEAPAIDYSSHIEQYWKIIESKDTPVNPALAEQREPMLLLLENINGSNTQAGLCHHDPVIENFVGSADRLYLIDWEYAAHGLLVMDYAALGIEWEIDSAIILAQSGVEPELLVTAQILYRYLCALWQETKILARA